MIGIDPATGESDRLVLRGLTDRHGGALGVYAAVLREGILSEGDEVRVMA
jgi:MOSC domain-containing protein YiiM